MSASGEPSRARRLVFRAAVSIALVAVLVWKVPLAGVAAALGSVPASGIALGLAVMPLQLVVGALRWRRMLIRTGARVPLGALVVDVLVGSAYNLVLPSAVGGDVVRAWRCSKRVDPPHHAWSTTLFERMIGVPALALVAVPGTLVLPGGRVLLWPTALVALVAAAMLLFADAPLRWASARLLARAPSIATVGHGVADDLGGPLGTIGARAEAFAWSLLYQLLGISILAACVVPSGEFGLVAAIYAAVPLIAIASMLPVTIAGLGLRESLFVVVLGRLGVDRATALALGVLWLGTYFVLAVPGVILALGAPPSSRPDSMTG